MKQIEMPVNMNIASGNKKENRCKKDTYRSIYNDYIEHIVKIGA